MRDVLASVVVMTQLLTTPVFAQQAAGSSDGQASKNSAPTSATASVRSGGAHGQMMHDSRRDARSGTEASKGTPNPTEKRTGAIMNLASDLATAKNGNVSSTNASMSHGNSAQATPQNRSPSEHK